MDLVSASRDKLLKPLQLVSGIVERRHTLPILANLLLKKNGQSVSLISTDIEIQITTHADFGVGSDNFSTTVGARKLVDILRALPESELKLSMKDSKMVVQSGKSKFTLQTLAASEFPMMSESSDILAKWEMSQKSLKQLISQVYFAMAQQDIRYYLNGMLLVVEGKTVIAVATDGHRLAYSHIVLDKEPTGSGAKQEVIIPRKTILELQHLLEDSDESVAISLSSNQIKFNFGDVELLSKLVEGKFPDFQRVIPKGHKNTLSVSRELLQSALQRAAILTSDKFKGVRCILSENCLTIQSTNAEQEEAQEDIETEYEGDKIDIGFNVSYLLDVLANLKNETIQISLGDSNSSAVITIPKQDGFKYVVMPMRI
ncbi:MAG: DNA polymerase III subunit beta [Burkholderiaceae bacterium]|jgi:DNA polymerase-3 subunit beta|uniref:DNA polymerase III subunit beta n=1 Tax=Polynucleobacter sp. MWH-Loch1C5 TaxID=2689108 RepID=UPI001C0D781F|nr:DNA polymerase III subunit beta [Polynucleobacter sp. MWH-Loch1C5]MBU3542466.1 DNA polymerase III subunit beta [Polynucleobacter sp. MWH-Loch1C5]NBV00081.1 DNA polymerase III subunit beta [Burkholderiaceae bacterium]